VAAGPERGLPSSGRRSASAEPLAGSTGSGDAERMASKKTVTLHNLAVLGAERLAAILVDLAEADAKVKRRLRLELAAQVGGDSIAGEIGKRITALRKARSFVDWQKRRDFVKDLDLQRRMITDRVAQTRADLALDLILLAGRRRQSMTARLPLHRMRSCTRLGLIFR
jgi:hypothetical protein